MYGVRWLIFIRTPYFGLLWLV